MTWQGNFGKFSGMNSLSPAELIAIIQAVRAGDRDAYQSLVMDTQDRVRRFLVARLANSVEVEELVQTTFISAYNRLDTYDPAKGRFIPWLIGIAHNHLRHHLRSRARNQEIGIDGLDALIAGELQADDDAQEQQLEALRGCLDKLPERTQMILSRRYGDNEDLAKLAQRFKKGQQALASMLMRLRRSLRRCIEERTAAL